MTFGDVSVGSSATQSLTITNSGTGAVNVSGSTISGTDLTFVGGSSPIAAGQSSTVQIQFAPQSPGDITGMFSISSNASNSPLSVSVKGSGRGPRLSVSPAPLNFGNVTVGQTGTQSVQLTNSGNADLIVNSRRFRERIWIHRAFAADNDQRWSEPPFLPRNLRPRQPEGRPEASALPTILAALRTCSLFPAAALRQTLR